MTGARTARAVPVPVPLSAEAREGDDSSQSSCLAAILETSDDAIVSKTLEGRILSWNPGATRLFGYAAAEVLDKSGTVIVPTELHEEAQGHLERIRVGQRIDHFETVRISKAGRHINVSLSISPLRDSYGNVVGVCELARDVSERMRAEAALRDSETQLTADVRAQRELSDLSTRLWGSRRLDDGLHEMLTAVVELLGADKGTVRLLSDDGAMLSLVAHRGFPLDYLERFREIPAQGNSVWPRALASGNRVLIEDTEIDPSYEPMRQAARDGGYRSIISTPLLGPGGTRLGVISTHFSSVMRRPTMAQLRRLDLYLRQASDFIERCKLEQVLQHSEQALRESDRRKDEFLALLAHELRNPLAPIRYALASGKKAGRTIAQQQRAEQVVERQVAHMSRLLDDLLDISRITRGILELKKTHAELTSVVAAAIETARPIIDEHHHRLSLDLPKQAVQIEADPVRLAQVFGNLLINAAKYTDAGGHIHLRAAQEADEIVIAVADNGIGIAPEMMPRLFTLFSQAAPAPKRAKDGLGVGLSLVRGLVTLHGGTVEAHSDGAGQGSVFIVRLPKGAPAREVRASEARPDPFETTSALKVLVVDDSPDAADTCATLLELCGHRVQKAYSGRRALEIASTFKPHVMLLDIGLPDIDGYELARTIRAAAWGSDSLLVAVTGWGQEEDRRRALEAGFDHHLTKPAAAEMLEALLNSVSAQQRGASRQSAQ